MTVNKRKKSSRQHGSHTHGWGAMKKHRGSGNRGGAGNAGSGKRADSNKPSVWSFENYFGKHGFKSKKRRISAVNISHLEQHLKKYIAKGLIKEEAGALTADLHKLGYTKLLGSGKTEKKWIIECESASQRAKQNVEQAGGKIILQKEENGNKEHTSKPA
ncbi:uL15 family ribosomal protein [Candidatus Woesearchaeota archaeon]|nr:uL15 family ribosomal protein [Candidatus Woesearchaeota archaeon]